MRIERVKNIVVFGDDSVDFGRTFLENDGRNPNPKDYYYGRFTDGATWAENFASRIGSHIISYGYGNATSSNTLFEGFLEDEKKIAPDIKQQVNMYLKDIKSNRIQQSSPESTLFVFSIGTNDFIKANAFLNSDKHYDNGHFISQKNEIYEKISCNLSESMSSLFKSLEVVKSNVLIVGVPSLHCSPYFSENLTKNGIKYSESNIVIEKETELLNNQIKKRFIFTNKDRDFISEKTTLPKHGLIDDKGDFGAYNENKLYGCKIPNIWFLDTREFVRENICTRNKRLNVDYNPLGSDVVYGYKGSNSTKIGLDFIKSNNIRPWMDQIHWSKESHLYFSDYLNRKIQSYSEDNHRSGNNKSLKNVFDRHRIGYCTNTQIIYPANAYYPKSTNDIFRDDLEIEFILQVLVLCVASKFVFDFISSFIKKGMFIFFH
ncbi:Thermolabile hemolysin [Smittium culicis]|uniref:Thermolabile hemolysin n=1 Tax=Smittium culicis TaxID=133412 RepID=A0A1R1X944_9FUNG|nr:Thermolabile hemolysin [Smittium culicis]